MTEEMKTTLWKSADKLHAEMDAAEASPEARIKEILTINNLSLFITSPVY